ncbi:MAG TPA: hypothetical protein PKE30_17660 [Niabella sp.]|nr:hypothetical protein [Niabella sp.]
MFNDDTKRKLAHILNGSSIEGTADNCTAARNYLCAGFSTGKTVKKNFEGQLIIKKEQEHCLKEFAQGYNLWVNQLPSHYLTRGGESQVYLEESGTHVIKTNDAVYYATWLEYFNSVMLHNLFFPDTAYNFLGFIKKADVLYAVVKQPFIIADGQARLQDIRSFLEYNGFENTKRQDYYHKEYGLILEDMHDENVIINTEKLFFIDTVFYIAANNGSTSD